MTVVCSEEDRSICARVHRHLVALPCVSTKLLALACALAMPPCLQVAAAQALKAAAKPVKVAESDVDVSETDAHVCTGGKVPVCQRALSPPAGPVEPLV